MGEEGVRGEGGGMVMVFWSRVGMGGDAFAYDG